MAEKVVVFAGSFDPFTRGHEEVVRQAMALFDRVIIGVGYSLDKKSVFTPEERVQMIREVFPQKSIDVKSFTGLVVKFAKTEGAMALVRGLRTENDFSYEMPMAMTNRQLEKSLQTVFLPTGADSQYISSSLVREVAHHGGDVSGFVPPAILKWVKKKYP